MSYRIFLITSILFFGCNDLFQNEHEKEAPVWIFMASAERQCITPEYASLKEAVNQLKENDILVFNSREVSFPVCTACTCPTGIQYSALIKLSDFKKASDLGWQRVDEGNDTAE